MTSRIRRTIYNVLFYSICNLYTIHQNILLCNWMIVLFCRNPFPLDFACGREVHLMFCITYCKISISLLSRLATSTSTFTKVNTSFSSTSTPIVLGLVHIANFVSENRGPDYKGNTWFTVELCYLTLVGNVARIWQMPHNLGAYFFNLYFD